MATKKKPIAYEYRTTTCDIGQESIRPYPPDDNPGWEMCGSAANSLKIFWFWRKRKL